MLWLFWHWRRAQIPSRDNIDTCNARARDKMLVFCVDLSRWRMSLVTCHSYRWSHGWIKTDTEKESDHSKTILESTITINWPKCVYLCKSVTSVAIVQTRGCIFINFHPQKALGVNYLTNSQIVCSLLTTHELFSCNSLSTIAPYLFAHLSVCLCVCAGESVSKTQAMAVGPSLYRYDFHLDNTNVKTADSLKILGVTLDNKLYFKPHISEQLKKAKASALCKVRKFISQTTMIRLYKAYTLPHLEYCSPLLLGISDGLNSKSEDTNYCILRTILGLSNLTEYSHLLNIGHLQTLETRRRFQTLVLLYKCIQRFESRLWCTRWWLSIKIVTF